MNRWFHDGESASLVSIDDRAFQYGDGLFETIAIRNGEPRLWEYHMDRLAMGCERMRIAVPDIQNLRQQLDDAVGRSQENPACCTAKIIISSGVSARGYARKSPTDAKSYIGVFAALPVGVEHYRGGVEARVCSTRLALFSVTAGLKTLNRLEQVLARSEFVGHSAFEGLTLDADERLICGTMSNVFLITGQQLITPAITRCGVSGVMRRHVLTLLDAAGIACGVRDVEVDELWAADGVFISNSQIGILPAKRCGSHSWLPQPLIRRLTDMLRHSGIYEGPA